MEKFAYKPPPPLDVSQLDQEGLYEEEGGYLCRRIEGIPMPIFMTPDRYRFSRQIQFRPGDICCNSYPKSGSNWMCYLLFLLTHDGKEPSDTTLR